MAIVEVYLVYAVALLALLAAVFGIWRLRQAKLPPPVVPPELEEPRAARPALQLVPPEAKAPPLEEAARPVAAPALRPLKEGLEKTRGGFIARIGGLLGRKELDAGLLGELEEILYTADIGTRTSTKLFEAVKKGLSREELKDAAAVWQVIRRESEAILAHAQHQAGEIDLDRARPLVVLAIGVNGVGKTTTIGKLAAQWSRPQPDAPKGRRVLLAAGDTFRAAAAEQLEVWGQRVGAPVVRGKEGADPSSVIFEAVRRAQAEGFDVVIADTAGRLHTKTELMDELQKVRRVIQKAQPDAPHETLLVLDATNGQNAIAQATLFKQAMDISGIVLTKLDGTAKGGVILGICDELAVPVRYVGIGEKVDDLRSFDPKEFVGALYDPTESAA